VKELKSMQTIYRADRVRPSFCLVLGGSFVAAAWTNIAAVDERLVLVLAGLLGGVSSSVSACAFC
jgi:hypothetical protein